MSIQAHTYADWGILSWGYGRFKAIPRPKAMAWNEVLWRRKKSENEKGGTCPSVPVEFRTIQLLAWK
jgi:hypothetical protein